MCVSIERNSDFKRVDFSSIFRVRESWTSYSTRIRCQTVNDSNEFRDRVVSLVRCSLSTFQKRHEGFGAKKNIEARKREKKERGIFVIRKSKLRLSRTIAVARVPRDLWFNVLSFADFNSRASNFPSRDFSPRETRFYPALYARERRDITVAFKLEKKERKRGGRKENRKVNEGRERTNESERKNKKREEQRMGRGVIPLTGFFPSPKSKLATLKLLIQVKQNITTITRSYLASDISLSSTRHAFPFSCRQAKERNEVRRELRG